MITIRYLRTALACLFSIFSVSAFSENYKATVQSGHPALEIIQVDTDEYSTLISFVYQDKGPATAPASFLDPIGWRISFEDGTVLRASNGREYHLLSGVNMPISSEAEFKRCCLDTKDQRHQFLLEFERLDDDVLSFDLIESEILSNPFNMYGVTLLKSESIEPIDIAAFIADYPVKEYGRYYSDDWPIYYYSYKGITVQSRMAFREDYGKYYSVAIDVQNLTGKSILFGKDNISAYAVAISSERSKKERYRTMTYMEKGGDPAALIPENLYVFSSSEYDKKIATAQAWAEAFAGVAAGLSAASAGYSSSTTTVSGSIDNRSAAAAVAWGTNGYGFAVGASRSHTSIYGTSRTESYDGAAAYWAQRQAYQDMANLSARNYQVRQTLTDGYIKRNTVQNEQDYSGFCNIEYAKADLIVIRVTIAGEHYDFLN